MANKMYVKDGMNFEGISMQEGKSSSTIKLLGFMIITAIVLGLVIFTAGSLFSGKNENVQNDAPRITILPTLSQEPINTPETSPTGKFISPTPRVTGKPTPTLSKKVTTTPVPLLTGSTKKMSLSIEVLNGSGTKGAAGKLSSLLTSAGYTVTGTGNADVFTYKGLTLNIKKSKMQQVDQLKKDLSANDYLVTNSTASLAETSAADVIITIGSE
jgi:hypothetical protein